MEKACRNRITTWCMMGLLVVGLTVWFALPARAVPIDYSFGNDPTDCCISGVFSLDKSLLTPYVTWDITDNFLNHYTNLSDIVVENNITIQNGINQYNLSTVQSGGFPFLVLQVILPTAQAPGSWTACTPVCIDTQLPIGGLIH